MEESTPEGPRVETLRTPDVPPRPPLEREKSVNVRPRSRGPTPVGDDVPAPPPDNAPAPVPEDPLATPAAPAAQGEWIAPARPSIITRAPAGPRCRGRKAEGEEAVKPGKISWVWRTKLKFLSARKEEWVKSAGKKTSGTFYTKMAKLFTAKYGFELKDEEDFEHDVEDPPDSVVDKVVNQRLAPEVAEARQTYHAKLCDRLGAWYRGQFANLVKEDKVAFAELFGGIQGVHVRSTFEARYLTLEKRAGHMGEAPPSKIKIQNEVTREVWDQETEDFQARVQAALEREYEANVKAWQESLADSPTRAPEEFAASLKSAAGYLQPFVDAIGERYGMCVSLLLCGPVGNRGGRLEMRSVHAGKTRGLVEEDWPMHDAKHFSVVEASMVDFAQSVFSEAECDARRTEEQEVDLPDSANMVAVPATARPLPSSSSAHPATGASSSRTGGAAAQAALSSWPSGGGARLSAGPALGNAAGGGGGAGNGGGDGAGNGEGDGAGDGGGDGAGNSTGDGGAGSAGDDEGNATQRVVDECWNRKDRKKWTEELERAHKGRERSKGWGIEWAGCVEKFFDFEAAWGYEDTGGSISTTDRLAAMKWWSGRARKWDSRVALGVMGSQGQDKSFVDDWWKWWGGLQPDERLRMGKVWTQPNSADWTGIAKLYGRNGLLQVMATLLWWGDKVADGTPMQQLDWSLAVGDVSWVLTELLRPGIIEKAGGKKRKAAKAGVNAEVEVGGKRKRSKKDEEATPPARRGHSDK
ncbi:hypothetical protein C8R44DRAFT_747893 [Mycena epipterygia]|nr:hypothetical protein C8R44DRAFT_747893 [Mycena epipterygia]